MPAAQNEPKVFSVRTPTEGGSKGENEEKKCKNRSVFDENTFFETAAKNKNFNMFFDFWGSNFFGLKMSKSFQCARPLQGAPSAETK